MTLREHDWRVTLRILGLTALAAGVIIGLAVIAVLVIGAIE